MSELILQIQNAANNLDCEKYIHIPSTQSSYVAIVHADSPAAQQYAVKLKNELVNYLTGLHLGVVQDVPDCGGNGRPLGNCQATQVTQNIKLLIVVGDGANYTLLVPGISAWQFEMMPILQQGQRVNFQFPVNEFNAAFWQQDIGEVVPEIIRKIGILPEERRIFISYRRDDTMPLAIQLYDKLHQQGFEVFQDCFSIEPGVNFQTRLYQELADKAMVLFIESETYLDSTWVQYEIAFSKKYRLGYMALNTPMPAVTVNAPKIPSIEDDSRIFLAPGDINLPTNTLTPVALDRIVSQIKEAHNRAIIRKRHYMNLNLYVALRYFGAGNIRYNNDVILADNPNGDYTVFSTPRPPLDKNYYYVQRNYCNRKVIFGPEFMEQHRKTVNDWLAQISGISYFHEGRLLDLTDGISNGTA